MGYVATGNPKGRPIIYCHDRLPRDINLTVALLCREYIKSKGNKNAIIGVAIADIEEGCRGEILKDIAFRRGYNKSQINWMLCEDAYYNRKRTVIRNIANKFNLV